MTHEEMIEQLENTILLIKQNGKDWWDERDIPVLEESIKAMQTEQEWIPVSERLPEKYGKYICTIDVYDRDRTVDFVTYDPNLGWYVHNVTAWMPQLEPWKEEE